MDCITFTANDAEERVAPASDGAVAASQDAGPLHLRPALKTGRIMVKDEDLCLHCGLCAERCPTGAWDMQKFLLEAPKTEYACQRR